jgi:hypothetical protein
MELVRGCPRFTMKAGWLSQRGTTMKKLSAGLWTCLVALLALGCGQKKVPAPDDSKPLETARDAAKKSGPDDNDRRQGIIFISEKSGYSVAFPPGVTALQEKGTSRQARGINLSSTTLQTSLGNTELQVVSMKLPEGVLKEAAKNKMLDRLRDGFVSSFKGKLVDEKKIQLDGNPGRDLRIQPSAADHLFRARVFMLKGHVYQITARGPKDKVASREVDEFLDSFKLTGK